MASSLPDLDLWRTWGDRTVDRPLLVFIIRQAVAESVVHVGERRVLFFLNRGIAARSLPFATFMSGIQLAIPPRSGDDDSQRRTDDFRSSGRAHTRALTGDI